MYQGGVEVNEILEKAHYGDVDCIDIGVDNGDAESFLALNIIKYVHRRNKKGCKESDIKKAFDYATMLALMNGYSVEELKQIIELRGGRRWK